MIKTVLTAITFYFIFATTYGQVIIKKDPVIEKMCSEVNTDSLKNYIKIMTGFGTRNTLSNQSSTTTGIGAARQWVFQKFKSFSNVNNPLTVNIDTTTLSADGRRVNRQILLGNVMARLEGTDKNDNRIFIISGHLDAMRTSVMDSVNGAPGANDDGSGVAAVLECARIMSARRFPATIIFIAVSGEEQGLLGSTYFANYNKTNNINVAAVLNNDIMGSNNSNGTNIIDNTRLRVFSEGLPAYELDKKSKTIRQLGLENDGASRQLARYVKEIGERYVANLEVKLIYRNDRFLRGGDHTPFVENGFAAVRITEMNENYEHQHQDVRIENGIQYGDLPEFLDYEYLRKNTVVNLSTLANLASAPGIPEAVTVDVSRLSNFTKLDWKQPLQGRPSGYYVLIRETTSPTWEKKIYTSNLTYTLPYSKDNYFFAVQAVDEEGHESLPMIPSPKR